jgi:selenocysteine-specific elongation factor
MARFIIGTAGHIDHGKSTLVHALTGTDPDRLPEEKRRGITVDLGYAFFGDIAAIIDVPGHERLIRNMVAGAATVDFALLVIAADDGVMPQTTEHLQILRLLGVRSGAVVITKCDMVDAAWSDLVEDQIRTAVANTFLADAPIFRVDSLSGRGIAELSRSLMNILTALSPREDRGVFRLPIDRVFSMKGRGTVVTGTVLAGSVQKDARIIALPGRRELRVKRVESHGQEVDCALAGQRAALNLIGNTDKLERGSTLTIPNGLTTTTRIRVFVERLLSVPPLKDRQRIRFLIGTQEIIGRVQLIGGDDDQRSVYANVLLESEATAVWGDRFILRRYSPLETLGGGIVLDPAAPKLRAHDIQSELETSRLLNVMDLNDAICAYVLCVAPFGIAADALAAVFGIPAKQITERCRICPKSKDILEIGAYFLSRAHFHSLCSKIKMHLRDLHEKSPESAGFSRAELLSSEHRAIHAPVLDHALQELLSHGDLAQDGALYREPQRRIAVNPAQADMMARVHDILRSSGFTPPSAGALAEILQRPAVEIEKTLVLLERSGKTRRLSTDLFFDVRQFDVAVERIRHFFEDNQELSVAEAARLLESSRKYVVPFLEYLDKKGVTIRSGNVRISGNRPHGPAE